MDTVLKALLRSNFLPFARKALRELDGVRLGDEAYSKYLARELDLFAKGDTYRVIINLPPGHLKTSLGSVCLAAWLLGQDPSLKLMVVSHAEHLSKSIARKIRSLLQSPLFKALFKTRITKGHAEVTDFGTASGGGVFVTSFQAGFTGRRADVIIVDDPHDITDDIEQIEATIEKFNTVLLSRLNDRKNGRVLVIAHRVNERDLYRAPHWKAQLEACDPTADRHQRSDLPNQQRRQWHRRRGEFCAQIRLARGLRRVRGEFVQSGLRHALSAGYRVQGLPAFRGDHFPSFPIR